MSDDFYTAAGRRQWDILQGARRQALNNLEDQKLYGDRDSAASAIQDLATIDSQLRELTDLHQRYAQSQQPPPPPTKEERLARPWDKMDWSDAWAIANESKHGVDPDAFRAGMAEVARRRARGE